MVKQSVWKFHYFSYSNKIKIFLFLYIVGFAVGTTTHTQELIKGGFLPYHHVPLWKNIYWTSLTFLDFLAIVLVLKSVIPALVVANLIIVSDVIINGSGIKLSELGGFSDYYRFMLQVLFCVYVLITTPIILKCLKTSE